MAVTYTNLTSNVYNGALDSNFITAREAATSSAEFKKRLWPEIVAKYGEGKYRFMDLISHGGSPFNLTGPDITVLEENSQKFVITVGDIGGGVGIATTAGGANASLQLDAGDYNSATGSLRLREGDEVIIPRGYTLSGNNEHYQAHIASGSGATTVFSLRPLSTTASITTAVPVGTKLVKGPWKTGLGGGQPSTGYINFLNTRKFYTQIVGETLKAEGSVQAVAMESFYGSDSKKFTNLVAEALWRAEFMFDDKIDFGLFSGATNTNTSVVTSPDQSGVARPVKSIKGHREYLADLAMKFTYDTTQPFSLSYFDLVDEMLDSQMVSSRNIVVGCGPDAYKKVENGMLEFTKEYTATDFTSALDELKVSYKVLYKSGRTYTFVLLDSFRDQNGLGLSSLGYREEMFMIPSETARVTYNDGTMDIPNIQLGYVNNNGENRTRMMGPIAGVNGMNIRPFSHQYDNVTWAIKSEYTLIDLKVNQQILFTPSVYKG